MLALLNKIAILFFILQIGQTVLHMVSITGEPRLCALFLRANADPNLADDRQFRPIHWACMQGHKTVVCILLNVLVEIADHCQIGVCIGSEK